MHVDGPLPILLLMFVLAGCHSQGAESTTPSPVDPAEEADGPEDEGLAVHEAVEAEESAPPGDLLRCALEVQALELGQAGDGFPSAPVVLGDAFVVAFTRTTAAGSELLVQRARIDGTLEDPVVVGDDVHYSRPHLISDGARAHVLATRASGVEMIRLDPTSGAGSGETPVALDHFPVGLALGPRGVVSVHTDGDRRVVWREGREDDVRLPAPRSVSTPREQILASGPSCDVVLVRHGHSARVTSICGSSSTRSRVLFRDGRRRWAEASVAAGPEGFVLVRTGPEIGDLEAYISDGSGAPGEPVAIPPPTSSSRPPDALVRRYPRAAALGLGWALTYWDGTGASLVRIDATGQVTGEAIELRSGDERGGHTDARMVATERAIAVTWQVEEPRRTHGFPEEEPRRPGPRLAILRCAR